MRFKPNKLKKAFDSGNSILTDKEFMKKSASKVYFMLLALNKSVLINFEKMFSLSRSQKDWKFYQWMTGREWSVCEVFVLPNICQVCLLPMNSF